MHQHYRKSFTNQPNSKTNYIAIEYYLHIVLSPLYLYTYMNLAKLTPVEPANNDQVFSGMVFVNAQGNIFGSPANAFPLYVTIKGFVMSCGVSNDIPAKKIAMNKQTRTFLHVSLSNELDVRLF